MLALTSASRGAMAEAWAIEGDAVRSATAVLRDSSQVCAACLGYLTRTLTGAGADCVRATAL